MSTLIAMAVHDTDENGRTHLTERTLDSLMDTLNFNKHRLIIVDNGSCQATKNLLSLHEGEKIKVVTLDKNYGTAYAVNQAIRTRKPGEFVIKMDNDVVIHKEYWIEEMEEVITRMPSIGILGLKRRDVMESTYAINTDQRSKLIEVPHENGQRWYVVESCKHVMGTCTMLNPALLHKVGYFYQMDGLYGFDDSLMCVRSYKAGFLNCFMCGIDIEHIDPGGDAYTDWKAKYAGGMLNAYAAQEHAYMTGMAGVYYNPFDQAERI